MMPYSRREFLKTGGIGLAGVSVFGKNLNFLPHSNDLYSISFSLMNEWASALLRLQIIDKTRTNDYGGIWCDADQAVHGRVGDTIYPFYYLADKTKDHRYIDAATLLYNWMENRVSQPDGSWLNEPVAGSWKGTTVFAAIALAEAIKNHGDIMEPAFKRRVSDRLIKAGEYIYGAFNLEYGNINYPVTASYGLSLLGTVLDVPKFRQRGKELAYQCIKCLTPKNKLLYGEGDVITPSKKGCFAVDLGYNVEESLPAFVMYGLLNNDAEILDTVTASMQSHLEFMLPDGGWDNSWGTRNYKWTYWGSRTSDGCQSAFALMAHRDPRFYKAALQNTLLMKQCTVNGLLQGGPHYAANHVPVCVHHTFSHIKALTTMLDYADQRNTVNTPKILLPREHPYGIRFMEDIQTCLIAKGLFRATVTGYDKEYKKTRDGHATGGALTMLWHQKTGPLLSASMNQYQMFEAGNMQPDNDPNSVALTPRIELWDGKTVYMNISDLSARIETRTSDNNLIIDTFSQLVDKDQNNPPTGKVNCRVSYIFSDDGMTLDFSFDKKAEGQARVVLPVISAITEHVEYQNNLVVIKKPSATVNIHSKQKLQVLSATNGRIFNYVPGFQAIPLFTAAADSRITIQVV